MADRHKSDPDSPESPIVLDDTELEDVEVLSFTNDVQIMTGSGAPVDYTDGDPVATGEGTAEKGSIYIRTSTGLAYTNTGTKAEPVWVLLTDASLTDHLNDATGAHAATAILADSTTLVGTGVNVQAVLEELDNGIADHLADAEGAHAATAIAADSTTLVGTGTTAQAVFEELDDAIAAVPAATATAIAAADIRTAAGVPSGAPTSGECPFAYDTTAVSGGFYYWDNSAWVKVATIL